MISHVFCAAGRDAENSRSVAPAENAKPALKPTRTVIKLKMPYRSAYTKYSTGAANINENSKGSVIPHTNAHSAVDATIPITAFLFSLGAQCTIARAAPGTPNIMQGKNPDIYIPSDQETSADVCPAQ